MKKCFGFALLLCLTAVLLFSCGGGGDHEHTMKHIDYKEPSCSKDGNMECWYCSGCQKYFFNEEGDSEESSTLPTLPKTNVHAYTEEVVADRYLSRAATCDTPAEYYLSCDCGDFLANKEQTFAYGDVAGHTYHESWNRADSEKHYKDPLCEHGTAVLEGAHVMENGACAECGYMPYTEGLVFEAVSGGYAVKAYQGSATAVVIPDRYLNKPVIEIGSDAFYNKGLTAITLPAGLKTIGYAAFSENPLLAAVTLPEGLEALASAAFAGCTALTEVNFPASLTEIPARAFEGCALTTVLTLPDTVERIAEGAFSGREYRGIWETYDASCDSGNLRILSVGANTELTDGITLYRNAFVGIVLRGVDDDRFDFVGDYIFSTDEDGVHHLRSYVGNGPKATLPKDYKGERYVVDDFAFSSPSLHHVVLTGGIEEMSMRAFSDCFNLFTLEFACYYSAGPDSFIVGGTTMNKPPRLVEVIDSYGIDRFRTIFNGYPSIHTGESRVEYHDGCAFLTGDDGTVYFIGYAGDDLASCGTRLEVTLPDVYSETGYVINKYAVRWNYEDLVLSENVADVLDTYEYPTRIRNLVNYKGGSYLGTAENPYFWCLEVYSGANDAEIHPDAKLLGTRARTRYSSTAYFFTSFDEAVALPDGYRKLLAENLVPPADYENLTLYKDGYYLGTAENPYAVLVALRTPTADEAPLTDVAIHADTREIGRDVFKNRDLVSVTFEGTVADWLAITLGTVASHPNYALSETELFAIGTGDDAVDFNDVTIPAGVTVLKYATLYGYGKGTAVISQFTVPAGITELESGAFYGANIRSLTIPVTVTKLGKDVLGSATVSLGVYVENVPAAAFMNSYLISVTIGDTVRTVGAMAFASCEDLHNVYIDKGVRSFGEGAFYDSMNGSGASSRATVTFRSGIEEWLKISFADAAATPMCNYLSGWNYPEFRYYVPANVNVPGTHYNAVPLQNLTVPAGAEILPYSLMHMSDLRTVTLDASVKALGDYAFYGCQYLERVSGGSVETLGEYTFGGCRRLTSVALSDKITAFPKGVFSECDLLTGVTLPAGLTEIGDYAFEGVQLAVSVIPEGVTRIGVSAFAWNEAITSLTIPASATEIGYDAFYGLTNLASVTVSADNPVYKSVEGVLYTKDGSTLLVYPKAKPDTSYAFPEGLLEIPANAFSGNDTLTSVTFPASLVKIRDYAFYGCDQLTSVTFAASGRLVSIHYYAFHGTGLTELVLPASLEKIGEGAFQSCVALTSVTFPASASLVKIDDRAFSQCPVLASFTFPEGLCEIGYSAFYESGLTSLSLPSTLTLIEGHAFENCLALQSVTIAEGTAQLDVGESAFRACIALSSVTIPARTASIGSQAFAGGWSYELGDLEMTLTSVIFTDTANWRYLYYYDGEEILAADLADPSIAATYLTETKTDMWYKYLEE